MLLWYIVTLQMLFEHFETRSSKNESNLEKQTATDITSGAPEEKEMEIATIESKDIVQAAIQYLTKLLVCQVDVANKKGTSKGIRFTRILNNVKNNMLKKNNSFTSNIVVKMISGYFRHTDMSLDTANLLSQFEIREPLFRSSLTTPQVQIVSQMLTVSAGQTWCEDDNRIDIGTATIRKISSDHSVKRPQHFLGITTELQSDEKNIIKCVPIWAKGLSFNQQLIEDIRKYAIFLANIQQRIVNKFADLEIIAEGPHRVKIDDLDDLSTFVSKNILARYVDIRYTLTMSLEEVFMRWDDTMNIMAVFAVEDVYQPLTEMPSLSHKLLLTERFLKQAIQQLVHQFNLHHYLYFYS